MRSRTKRVVATSDRASAWAAVGRRSLPGEHRARLSTKEFLSAARLPRAVLKGLDGVDWGGRENWPRFACNLMAETPNRWRSADVSGNSANEDMPHALVEDKFNGTWEWAQANMARLTFAC